MADTVRTQAALQTLLADNVIGDISPQDVRDFLVSVYGLDKSEEVAVTTTATLTIGKSHTCSGTTADYTVTLPPAASHTRELLHVSMSSALTKLVTVKGNGAELIDTLNERKMWANEDALLKSNGTSWRKVGGKSIPMSCKMYPSAETALTSASTYYKVAHNTVSSDNTGLMADTTNYRIYCRRTNPYIASGKMLISRTGAALLNTACPLAVGFFQKNQTTAGTAGFLAYTTVNGQVSGYAVPQPQEQISLVAGDYLHATAQVDITGLVVYSGVEYSQFTLRELITW